MGIKIYTYTLIYPMIRKDMMKNTNELERGKR